MEKSTHTPEYAALRSELRAARESAGLSQRELALRLKVHRSWIAKVEMGERRIDFVELCSFVAACGVDPTAVCGKLIEFISKKKQSRHAKGGRSK